MSSLVFSEAAKRFQQRVTALAPTAPISTIRTSWAHADVDNLAPLLFSNPEHEKDERVLRNISDCEQVFVVWKTFVGIFSLFDAADNSSTVDPRTVAYRFLQLHSDSNYNFELISGAASEFARCAARGVPSQREFEFAYQGAITFALSGRVGEASLLLESMIQGVNRVVESRNLRNNNSNNNNDDENDAAGGPFSPEEQHVFLAIVQLLRMPFTESPSALAKWRSAASKLLADIRSVAVVTPGRIPELDILRRFVLQVLFIISGDTKVLKEAVTSCDFFEGKAMWYAAGSCSLMSPLATRKQLVGFFKEFGSIAQTSSSFSPVRVTGGNAVSFDNSAPASEWDRLFIDAISVDESCALVQVVQSAVNFATNRAPGNNTVATLSALMGAHLADLCCDLQTPDQLLERNNLVENYVRSLFVHFPGLWEIALSYVTSSPLMDPSVIVMCLNHGQETDLELTQRLFDEVVHPRSPHQQQLRARWRQSNPNIDWASIFETIDIVIDEERRKLSLKRAETLWNDEGRYTDAVNLLVSTGSFTAAEHMIRKALENFSLLSSSVKNRNSKNNNRNDDDAAEAFDADDDEEEQQQQQQLFYNPVLAIGDAAIMGQVSDPTLEGKLQRHAAHNLIVASSSTPTPLALCRRVAELFTARKAINVLDFILPIISDQNFVISTPSSVKKFVLSLALANVSRATMEQILVINCVVQQCEKELGGERNLNEYSKNILELLVE